MKRADGRSADELRPVKIRTGVQGYAEGSALIAAGATRVLCAVSVEETVPRWLRGSGRGWVTAEYAMLPRSTHTRTPRARNAGGRASEIQRLIGRSLRAVVDLDALGQRMLTVDCDVLQADGGTRTAAITGAYVALHKAASGLVSAGKLPRLPFRAGLAAVSVGIVDGEPLLDLCMERFCQRAAAAGASGLVVPDLPLEEARQLSRLAAGQGLDLVLLVAPTTPPDRLARIHQASRGFTYLVSVTGVTGMRSRLEARVSTLIPRLRRHSDLPVAVGFGISGPEQALEVRRWGSDGAIVGSAFVQRIADAVAQGTRPAAAAGRLCAELSAALHD